MFPFLCDDLRNCGNGSRVMAVECYELVLKVSKHHALHRNRRSRYGVSSEEASYGAKNEAANATKPVAATPRPATTLQFTAEDSPMLLLVRAEFCEITDHVPCSEPSDEDLPGVNAYGAMLAGMIDLHDPIAEVVEHVQVKPDRCHT